MYTCLTCHVSDDIARHLSQTRHKAVADARGDPVACEECGEQNIHLLLVLRYGLSDLNLLCGECYRAAGAAALAEYTLSNGLFFLKLALYQKVRDLECSSCGSDRRLCVASSGAAKGDVWCKDCIKKHALSPDAFVSEDSDTFLYALLGLKESAKTPALLKRHTRKVGRGRAARPKKDDPDAERRRAHYESTKAAKISFKSDKTIKAVGSSSASPSILRSATPLLRPADSKGGKKKPAASAGASGPKPLFSEKKGAKPDKLSSKPDKQSSKPDKLSSKPDKKDPKSDIKGTKSDKKGKTSDKKGDKAQLTGPTLEPAAPKNGLSRSKPQPKGLKDEPAKAKSESKKAKPETKGLQQDSKSKANASLKAKNGKRAESSAPLNDRKPKLSSNQPAGAQAPNSKTSPDSSKPASDSKAASADTVIKLPPGISKYEPSPAPKLTYDSMDEYFNEMCYNLFLEEKISLRNSHGSMLLAGDFELEWYADQDKKHKQYKLSILLSPEILDRFLTKKMQNLKKNPFVVGQSLILMIGEDIPWYGNIVFVDTMSASGKKGKPKRGRAPRNDNSPKVLEIVVELYAWNKMPLPITANVKDLKVLPVSVPVSRVFTAMSRILNPRFLDMILGKKPIRQIFFKNYLKFSKETFNESQKIAMQSVMNNSITVLQGPPGTGKTSTIYEIILQLLENLNTYPILVVAASNIAIDNIAEKLLEKHGKSILRIVSLEKEPEYNREHPLASICLHHRVFDGMPLHLQESIREMRRPNSNISANQYKKLLTAQISYSDMIIALSRVIFTTTVVAGGNQLKSIPKMPVIIMDEATQSSEPTTLIPLSMNGVEKFVFVGDQKQLSSFSQVPNLSLSLFERILLNGSYKTPHMLDTQYRMHPAISEFPRTKFYDGLLKDGLTAADRVMEGISKPVVFWDTLGTAPEGTVFSKFREDSGLTYHNAGEVSYVEKVLLHLIYEKNVKRSQIGVITPYRGQRDKLSAALAKNDLVNPEKDIVHVEVDREDFFNESKPVTIHTVADIMVASVDAFQGREKDFLIMSCVRSNKQNKIGFLSDARRMNVALTRARYGLVLIGDIECLRNADELWREYIESLEKKACLLQTPDFTLG